MTGFKIDHPTHYGTKEQDNQVNLHVLQHDKLQPCAWKNVSGKAEILESREIAPHSPSKYTECYISISYIQSAKFNVKIQNGSNMVQEKPTPMLHFPFIHALSSFT